MDRTYLLAARDDHVVQRQAARELPAGSHRSSVEQRALLDREALGEHVRDRRVELLDRRSGQEAETAEIHAQQRNAERRDRARRSEDRAVAAEDAGDGRALEARRQRARVEPELDHLVSASAELRGGTVRGLQ